MKYACALCGRKSNSEEMVFSRFTRQRYCGVEMRACEARSARRKRRHQKSVPA